MKKIKIKHVDGITDVMATPSISGGEVNLEYRYEGMTYGRTLTMQEAVKMGIVECDHPSMLPMLGYENSVIGDFCEVCGKEFPLSNINVKHHSFFKTDYTDLDSKNYGK